jgi:hypothetical protein
VHDGGPAADLPEGDAPRELADDVALAVGEADVFDGEGHFVGCLAEDDLGGGVRQQSLGDLGGGALWPQLGIYPTPV